MRTSGGYWLRAEDPLRPPPGITEAAHDRLVSGGGTRGEGGSRPLAPGVCRGLEELRRQADRRAVLGRRSVPVPPVRRAGAGPGGPVDEVYDNCFVMRFDSAGRCCEFTEWYVRRPRG